MTTLTSRIQIGSTEERPQPQSSPLRGVSKVISVVSSSFQLIKEYLTVAALLTKDFANGCLFRLSPRFFGRIDGPSLNELELLSLCAPPTILDRPLLEQGEILSYVRMVRNTNNQDWDSWSFDLFRHLTDTYLLMLKDPAERARYQNVPYPGKFERTLRQQLVCNHLKAHKDNQFAARIEGNLLNGCFAFKTTSKSSDRAELRGKTRIQRLE